MRALNYEAAYGSARSPVFGRDAIATSHPLASQAGMAMLMRGGNAVDAALAAAMALTVVEPTGCGIGSDAFAIVWDGRELHGLNSSGRSPAAWTRERFAGRSATPELGWDAVTVPGAVAGWAKLVQRFGRLSFAEIAAPAIRFAREGFAVGPIVATLWAARGRNARRAAGLRGVLPAARAGAARRRGVSIRSACPHAREHRRIGRRLLLSRRTRAGDRHRRRAVRRRDDAGRHRGA